MKVIRIVTLIFLSIVLGISVFIAQLAFRIETNVLSYNFMSAGLQTILEPLSDPQIHTETIHGAFSFIRRRLAISIPRELEPHILEAAVEGFSVAWIKATAQQVLYSFFQIVNGNENSLNLAIPIGNFKNAFLNIVREQVDSRYLSEVSRELDRMPSVIQLEDDVPVDVQNRVVTSVRRSRVLLILLQYVVPGVLILLCFVFRRIGSGLVAVGSSFLVSGASLMVGIAVWLPGAPAMIERIFRNEIPGFFHWIFDGFVNLLSQIINSAMPVAIIVLSVGSVFMTLGILLISKGKDVISA